MTARLPHRPPVRLRRLAFPLVGACLVALAPASAAGAQSDGSCSSEGVLSPVEVRVTSPARGSTVTGPNVTVRGTASVLLGELTRVEVSVGDETVARNYAADSSIDFDLTVNAADVPAGTATVRVVACSSSVRGEDRFTVTYHPRAAATTTSTLRTSTTSVSSSGGATGPTTTAAAQTVAGAVVAGSPSASTTTPGQTTIASQPTTTLAAAAPAPAAGNRPEPVRPGTNTDGSVVLSDSPDEGSSRPPLWVGAVVGLSGGIGLLFSATTWRRRHQPPSLEPVDPELVEVG